MKFASIVSAVYVASVLALTPAAPALAQTSGMMPTMSPEMMQMMRMMQTMHSGALPRMAMMGAALMTPPGSAIQNVEGHIAFLKAELKITDAQQNAWDQFADALRMNAKALSGAPGGIMGEIMGGADKRMPLAARLEQQERLFTLHLEALKRSRTALEGLQAALSDEQKKQLDGLI